MKVELVEEIKPGTGTMYAIIVDDSTVKWFAQKEPAESFYNLILADPSVVETKRNILKSEEINVPLEEQNN
jgi:hypothetical protein